LRLGEIFLRDRQKTFKDLNFVTDADKAIINLNREFTFYHYTYEDRLPLILKENSGLWARREVACPEPPDELRDFHLVEGFLSPLPHWLSTSSYYGALGLNLVKRYIGDILLEIRIPVDQFPVYIADYAHVLECKLTEYDFGLDSKGLGLGYDCSNGKECTQAYVNSYLPIHDYAGQHHAPIVQVVRRGEGIAVPSRFIKVCDVQPLKHSI